MERIVGANDNNPEAAYRERLKDWCETDRAFATAVAAVAGHLAELSALAEEVESKRAALAVEHGRLSAEGARVSAPRVLDRDAAMVLVAARTGQGAVIGAVAYVAKSKPKNQRKRAQPSSLR